jgi:hypothetical protein
MRMLLPGLALLGLVATSGPARAEWSFNFQLEHYRWKESTNPEVKISGWEPGIGISWMQDKDWGWRFRYRGELYAGSFNYDGATLGGAPVQDKADYAGVSNEIDALYRPSPDSWLQLLTGIGLDYWERRFPTSAAGTAFSGHQQEDWTTVFLRVGLEAGNRARRGWFASAGLKYPLDTRVNAHFDDIGFNQNPELTPGRRFSAYADAGYRLASQWRLTAYYEGYRFSQSPAVVVTSGTSAFGFVQPESKQDEVGLRLEYIF